MRRKIKPYFNLMIIIVLAGFIFINQAQAEEKIETRQMAAQRLLILQECISASGRLNSILIGWIIPID